MDAGSALRQFLFLGLFDQFNFIAFRASIKAKPLRPDARWAVREFHAQGSQVPAKFFETCDFKGQMRQVRLDLDGAALGKKANFDQFLALRGFRKTSSEPRGDLLRRTSRRPGRPCKT